MEPIIINKANPDYADQLGFLIGMEFQPIYKKIKMPVFFFAGWTIVVIGLLTLTESDQFISYKAVFSVFTCVLWATALLYFFSIFIKRNKRLRWKNQLLAYTFIGDYSYHLYFDDEKISYSTSTYTTALNWDYYKHWAEDKSSLFIFPENEIYTALYYSRAELGIENYERLKEIVSAKLILINSNSDR